MKMKAKFYKLRAVVLLYVLKFLTKILFVESSPIFSVTALISKGEKLLFLNLSYQKGLGLPGGIVKKDETLEEAVKREVLEETGLKVVDCKYFTSVFAQYKGIPTASAVFIVKTVGNTKPSEEGGLIWMKPEEAMDKLFYKDNGTTLRKYLKKSF